MNTVSHFSRNHDTAFNVDVIECDSFRLDIKGTENAPIYLSVALHRSSDFVIGWKISQRPPGYLPTLQAIRAALNSTRLFNKAAPCYVIDDHAGGRTIQHVLNRADVHVRSAFDPFHPTERFYRVLNRTFINSLLLRFDHEAATTPISLTQLRKLFKSWLFDYHWLPSKHLSPAQLFIHFDLREVPRSLADIREPIVTGQQTKASRRHSANGKKSRHAIFACNYVVRRSIRPVQPTEANGAQPVKRFNRFQSVVDSRKP